MKPDLKILLVEDSDSFRESVIQLLGVYNDVEGVADLRSARASLQASAYEVIILDKGLPDGNGMDLIPEIKADHPNSVIIVLTADSDFHSVKRCMNAGADDYVVKSDHVIADLLVRIPFVVERAADALRLRSLKDQVREAFRYEIVGKSRQTMELREQILSLKGTFPHVLITGESGTGKELVARRINALSDGKQRPLVVINCAAIPLSLLEDELFGHQKGAFTGAVSDKPGKFELAHNGDLFLDEIGELPVEAQAKLLRVIQDGRFFRVGGSKPIQVVCRVIAATNRNIEEMVRKGTFRQDLYYRLNVVRLHTAPLRQRLEDIPDLVSYLILKLAGSSFSLSDKAVQRLAQHDWPGNIRELSNVVERAYLRAHKEGAVQIGPQHIAIDQVGGPAGVIRDLEATLPATPDDITNESFQRFVEAAERLYLTSALEAMGGNAADTGTKLGLARSTMFKRLAQLGIPRRGYSSAGLTRMIKPDDRAPALEAK